MSIRRINANNWAYEIWKSQHAYKPAPNVRGTVRYTPADPDHVEYLYLVMKVIGEHYGDLSEQGEWQEGPMEQL